MFDSIINEAEGKFNLGGKSGTLLSELLALMTDGTGGGLAGFLERFNQVGLGDTASSWVNSGTNTPLSNEQLKSALGSDTIDEIANRAGADYQTTASAAAYLIPRIVDNLTPNGVIPESGDVLSRIGDYSTGANETIGATGTSKAETFDRVGTAASDTLDADTRNVGGLNTNVGNMRSVGDRPNIPLTRAVDQFDEDEDNSPLKWILPLLLLGLLLTLGYTFCSKAPEPTATNVNVNVNKVNMNANVANQ
ncbi:MAG: YidB family protein [Acidobacteriota bacterium]|nr:YidB family protein [Acidobacteriota bacterium]